MIPKSVVEWLQRAMNPGALETFARKNNIDGLPIGKIASLFAAQYLQQEYGLSIPGGTEVVAAYIRNDWQGFINGDPQAIANELNKNGETFSIFGMDFTFGGQTFDWRILAGIGIAGYFAYKFFKA